MLLIVIGAVIVILIVVRLIAHKASLVRERERVERIEIEHMKRSRIWSEHLERGKVRETKSK